LHSGEGGPNADRFAALALGKRRADQCQRAWNQKCGAETLGWTARRVFLWRLHSGYTPMSDDEETNDPLVADVRNFYNVEKWTRDGQRAGTYPGCPARN
jgi:hypothetical protein